MERSKGELERRCEELGKNEVNLKKGLEGEVGRLEGEVGVARGKNDVSGGWFFAFFWQRNWQFFLATLQFLGHFLVCQFFSWKYLAVYNFKNGSLPIFSCQFHCQNLTEFFPANCFELFFF